MTVSDAGLDDAILQRLETLETGLAKLIAIEEIRLLKAQYFRLLDDRDFQGMANVFCRDAVFDCSDGLRIRNLHGDLEGPVGPIVVGRDNIMSWIAEAFSEKTSLHHGHSHEIIIVNEDEAHGVVAMEDRIRTSDRSRVVIEAAGHYIEQYRQEEGEWRIVHARLTRIYVDVFNEDDNTSRIR